MINNTRPDAQARSIRRHEDCMRRRLVFQQGLTSFIISKLDLWALLYLLTRPTTTKLPVHFVSMSTCFQPSVRPTDRQTGFIRTAGQQQTQWQRSPSWCQMEVELLAACSTARPCFATEHLLGHTQMHTHTHAHRCIVQTVCIIPWAMVLALSLIYVSIRSVPLPPRFDVFALKD
jgi:hypothetical protein